MSNYRNYENPLILREMIIEQREHVAYLIKSGCRLEYIKDEIKERRKESAITTEELR